ncbi:MAG: prepilin-type N-terminal cleavage/methylation domain-containing protein [Rubrivivax sp.]|nr:prepilin-type N-terminal cleavage/methylation domain-containing protein [Rubrivivax sp.]
MPLAVTGVARARTARGFTLIELMTAIALVAVLASLAVSGWDGWRNKVRTKKAQEDIIAIGAVVDQHLQDTGALPADLAAIGRSGLRDPWGNAYEYLPLVTPAAKGAARKDHSLVPLNSDYDLYSKGPDGATAAPLTAKASRDDILRANNGRFVGPASMY